MVSPSEIGLRGLFTSHAYAVFRGLTRRCDYVFRRHHKRLIVVDDGLSAARRSTVFEFGLSIVRNLPNI